MNTTRTLYDRILERQSFLCVGLDPDITRLPQGISQDMEGVKAFLLKIIDATLPYAIAFKPNFAFFETFGSQGWDVLSEIIHVIPDSHLVIGDAKRGDIGNTAAQYANAIFETLGCDAVTVSPYMGMDTIAPFLAHNNKWTILLTLTSNPGSADFQRLKLADGGTLWEDVLRSGVNIAGPDRIMFVVGGTHPDDFRRVREIAPDHFLLVPGFGAQQGSLKEVAQNGFNAQCGILANVSRAILYASSDSDFASAASHVAQQYQQEMAALLQEYLEV